MVYSAMYTCWPFRVKAAVKLCDATLASFPVIPWTHYVFGCTFLSVVHSDPPFLWPIFSHPPYSVGATTISLRSCNDTITEQGSKGDCYFWWWHRVPQDGCVMIYLMMGCLELTQQKHYHQWKELHGTDTVHLESVRLKKDAQNKCCLLVAPLRVGRVTTGRLDSGPIKHWEVKLCSIIAKAFS